MLEGIANFARARGLWIWSDEVYEGIVYDGAGVPIRTMAPERTFSVYSFSKTYGMAGNRCGYILGPDAGVMASVRKATVHHYYSACTGAHWLRSDRDGLRWSVAG